MWSVEGCFIACDLNVNQSSIESKFMQNINSHIFLVQTGIDIPKSMIFVFNLIRAICCEEERIKLMIVEYIKMNFGT